MFTRSAGICLTSLKWHEAIFVRRDSSLEIMDCEHKTSRSNLVICPLSSIPIINGHTHSKNAHTHTQRQTGDRHTHTPLSTLPEALVLIPRSLFSVTHGRGGSCRRSLTARLTFALAADLFFGGTGSRTGGGGRGWQIVTHCREHCQRSNLH